MDEDVAWFDIPVHNIVFNQHFEGLQEIFEIFQSPFFAKVLVLFDQRLESATIAVLVHEVHIVGSFENLDELDDVGGVLYFGEGLDLIDGELFESRT